MTDKQAPALHEPSCERAVRDLERLQRLRASKFVGVLVAQLRFDAEEWASWDGTIAEDYKGQALARANTMRDLIALLEPEGE
jgi:hypothetical protein